MSERLTPEREAERLQGLLYEAITKFQQTAQLSSLQHAQMRGYLAEHLAPVLLAELGPVRAERDKARERVETVRALCDAADHAGISSGGWFTVEAVRKAITGQAVAR